MALFRCWEDHWETRKFGNDVDTWALVCDKKAADSITLIGPKTTQPWQNVVFTLACSDGLKSWNLPLEDFSINVPGAEVTLALSNTIEVTLVLEQDCALSVTWRGWPVKGSPWKIKVFEV